MATKSTKTTKPAKTTRTTRSTRKTAPVSTPKQGKPVFRTGTWVALIVLLAVIGTAVYMNRKAEEAATATETPAPEQSFLFEQDSLVTSIEVKPADGDTVKLERNEEKAWVLSQPEEAEADQGSAEAAASQIVALGIVTTLEKKDPSIFGLEKPAFTITIGFDGGKTSTLEVGDATPSGNGYYVRLDGDTIYVVSIEGIDALTSLVSAPPYLSTPTAIPTSTSTPLPTETPVPATETSSTPEATPTP